MRIATLGFIAAALLATAAMPVANAGSLLLGNVERKLERMDARDYRGHRSEGRQNRRHADRSYRRHDSDRHHRRRHASGHRYYRGHRRYGHSRIVFRHHGHGNPVPAIAGGIIGGAIAHGASGGDQGATAVGAIIGAIIATDAARHRRHH